MNFRSVSVLEFDGRKFFLAESESCSGRFCRIDRLSLDPALLFDDITEISNLLFTLYDLHEQGLFVIHIERIELFLQAGENVRGRTIELEIGALNGPRTCLLKEWLFSVI